MLKKASGSLFVILLTVWMAGCATGRNYQTDIDALNSRISSLEGQLSVKDEEIARLQSQLGQSEIEKRELGSKLSQLEAAKASMQPESDLK